VQAFEFAFDWLGFGAKTAVGYGAMVRDTDADEEREKIARELEQESAHQREQAALEASPEPLRSILTKEQVIRSRNPPNTKEYIFRYQAIDEILKEEPQRLEELSTVIEELRDSMIDDNVWKEAGGAKHRKNIARTSQVKKWLNQG
jgi:CRISPR-associated protein Cmr6